MYHSSMPKATIRQIQHLADLTIVVFAAETYIRETSIRWSLKQDRG